jgi:peptide/nickel transport system substrate-binding protein
VETLLLNLDPRTGHPALQQEEVRRAIGAALDRERICQTLAPGQADPAASLWAGTMFEDPGLRSLPSTEAEVLLEQAGWRDEDGDGVRERDGMELVLRYAVPASGVNRAGVQVAVTEMLGQVGIGLVAGNLEAGEWDLAEWAEPPVGYPDPDDPRWLCVEAQPGGLNRAGVCDEELDRLLYAQAETPDLDERAALFYAIEGLNRERAWWVPLCQIYDLWLVRDDLSGLHPWRENPFWNVEEWIAE